MNEAPLYLKDSVRRDTRAAVEPKRINKDSHGQILALASAISHGNALKPLKLFPSRPAAGNG